MKPIKLALLSSLAVFALLFPPTGRAQTNAYDDAYHYAYASATWYSLFETPPGINYGFGYTAWVVRTNGPGSHGFFSTRNGTPLPAISSPTNFVDAPGNNGSAHVWGIFANGTGVNSSTMYRGFSNALDTTVSFKLQWETIGIGSSTTKLGGFSLRNGNATNDTADYLTAARFVFRYAGGGSNSFSFIDGDGTNHIGIPFGSNPLACEFTLRSADTYRFVVKSLVSGAILAILDDRPLAGSGNIESVALFAQQPDGNQNFNRMQIVSNSVAPPIIVNVQPTNGSIYVDAATRNVSFEVSSIGSLLMASNVTLTLNDVKQTNLLNTTGPTNQLFVTNASLLLPNTLYSAVIIAVDSNNNRATNNFNFNTFSPNNLCIDAEDYNFNGGEFFPNPTPNEYAGQLGVNGIDYLEHDLSGTNMANFYRFGDLPQILLVTGDPYDHAGFGAVLATDYEIGFTDAGDWQNYTRELNNTNYTVYARAASGGGNGTILVERLANTTATSTDQPAAALGTCIIPATGGSKIYTGQLIPLTDFFSNPVQIRFPGTNTLRCTAINNRTYNLNYLMFVPNTNTATLKPYLSAGYPFPGATGVALDNRPVFTIANRQTAVNPGTIQLFLGTNNVTGSITLSNNAAGTVVTFVPPVFFSPNSNYTLTTIYTDNGGSPTTTTNTWQFTTANLPYTVLPPADAIPVEAASAPGFAARIYKVEDAAPTTASIANAEAELSGTRTNIATSLPYTNLITGNFLAQAYAETNTLNYDTTGAPTGTPAFPFKTAFPYVAANAVNNNVAVEALMYLQLTNGNYVFAVRSDDGFKLTEGPTPTSMSLTLGSFDGGRGNGTPTLMYVTVVTNGVYPMRLLYYQAGAGGNLEFYSLNNGVPALINGTNTNAIKAFQSVASAALPVTLLNPAHSAGTTTFSFLTQAGHTHYVEYKNNLSDLSWTPLTTIAGSGSITNMADNTATGNGRFYRVRSQ